MFRAKIVRFGANYLNVAKHGNTCWRGEVVTGKKIYAQINSREENRAIHNLISAFDNNSVCKFSDHISLQNETNLTQARVSFQNRTNQIEARITLLEHTQLTAMRSKNEKRNKQLKKSCRDIINSSQQMRSILDVLSQSDIIQRELLTSTKNRLKYVQPDLTSTFHQSLIKICGDTLTSLQDCASQIEARITLPANKVKVMASRSTNKEDGSNKIRRTLNSLSPNNRESTKYQHKFKTEKSSRRIVSGSHQMRSILNILSSNNTIQRDYSTSTRSRQTVKPKDIQSDINLQEVDPIPPNIKSKPDMLPYPLSDIERRKLLKVYPVPKNVLHSIFDIVSKELKNKSYALKPQYTSKNPHKGCLFWECTYHLKWPQDIKFTTSAFSKQEASSKCSLLALNYLVTNGHITKEKHPILHAEVDKQKLSVFSLHPKAEKSMKELVKCYETDFMPLLMNSLSNKDEAFSVKMENYSDDEMKITKRKFKAENYYLVKEPVRLPISDYKDDIVNIIRQNQVVIIKGEPGCGKSTRVPQYVLESWAKSGREEGEDCRIIVTQPRRIAAISLAERVANERSETVGPTVGYQVRLKSNFNNNTGHVLYCTTGILLRRLQTDPNLSDCTHIILDEAHERDVNTDLLLNLIRQSIQLNPNLRLIIMSATIDAEVFQEYFKTASVIHIPGFTYPVKVNFLEHSSNLEKTMAMCNSNNPTVVHEDVAKLIKYIDSKRGEGAILCFLPGWDDITKVRKYFDSGSSTMTVSCLHSRMQDSDQRLIFNRPPPGVRKVILATNIAETSVTIDDVVYVIDTGIQKEKRFDVEKGIVCIDNNWVSKSSMAQRKGRAGRVTSGESFHLYPKTKYNTFIDYTTPEILRTSLTKIVLDSKVYSNNMGATEFLNRLLSPPDNTAILKAVDELKELELLNSNENLTLLGRVISNFQLEPNLGKAMVNSVIFKCVTPVVDIVTLFSAETELFATGLTDKEKINKTKREFSKTSDHLSLMRIFEKWLEYLENSESRMAKYFCSENHLIDYKLYTIRQLRTIHFEYLHKGLLNVIPISDTLSDNNELVKAVLLSGIGHVLQHRNYDVVKGRLKKSNVLLTRNNHKATISSDSVNFKRGNYPTSYLFYINETRSNIRRTTTVRETSLLSPIALYLFKNNDVIIEKIPEKYINENINPNEQVLLKLEGTKLECICDKNQAELIKKCKESIVSGMQYYIFQLTKGGEYDSEINKKWDEILFCLSNILEVHAVNDK